MSLELSFLDRMTLDFPLLIPLQIQDIETGEEQCEFEGYIQFNQQQFRIRIGVTNFNQQQHQQQQAPHHHQDQAGFLKRKPRSDEEPFSSNKKLTVQADNTSNSPNQISPGRAAIPTSAGSSSSPVSSGFHLSSKSRRLVFDVEPSLFSLLQPSTRVLIEVYPTHRHLAKGSSRLFRRVFDLIRFY